VFKDIEKIRTEKFRVAQALIRCYLGSRQGLSELRILRSERNLQGDYAEWLVAELLRLKLAESTIQKGYDATDRKGRTYQIKSRIVDSLAKNTSFDWRDINHRFDFLIGVFFSRSFEVLQIIRVPYEVGKWNVEWGHVEWGQIFILDFSMPF
jgi:hypothetical protein